MANFATNASGAKFLAGEITQVKESIPWVRCASGNVLTLSDVETLQVMMVMFVQVRGRGKRSRRHGLSFHGLAEGVEEAVASF